MYKKGIYKILANEPLTASVWRMVLEGDTEWIVRPGQFVNIALEGRYLRRPISVCDCDARTLTLIYKVVGGGTEQMSRMAAGAELDLLTGLGNGFDTSNDARRPLLVGGGVGVPPLYKLAKALLAEGKPVSVVLGFNTADEIFYADEFRALGCDVHVATADGSAGTKGFVTTAIAGDGIDFDNNYFNALYQGIPVGGYTKMVANMLDGVEVRLGEDYLEKKAEYDALAEKVIYTGPIDAYFDYQMGYLEYRSVRFETELLDKPNFQGNAAVNYTDRETPWTRIIEHK